VNSNLFQHALRSLHTKVIVMTKNTLKKMYQAILSAAITLALSSFSAGVMANEEGYPLDKAPNRLNNQAALQNGAKLFTNYCMNCHGAHSVRYTDLRKLGLTDEEIKENLLFTGEKVGDLMKVSMSPTDAKAWFGKAPPDLSVEVRSRGADWVYTYLRTFYRDDSRPTGWNNLVYKNVGMPHVLWTLQGDRAAKFEEVKNHEGNAEEHFTGFEQLTPGKMKDQEYDDNIGDLVAYMTWMSEPNQLNRKRTGVIVLLFLAVFTIVAWRLNKTYWKSIK
jgi:ubiquinol-cytochrome c reductase cytochrome c1 subunit